MNIEELRDYCLSKQGAEESTPFGPDTLVFKVGGKAFLLTGFDSDPLQFNVKCDPERAIALREEFSFVLPGYHMNKKHWNTVVAGKGATMKFLQEQIDHSYDLVFNGLPKLTRQKIKK